jgi:hypothetical protein
VKLIECYEQIADLRQTLKEIRRLAEDMPMTPLAMSIFERADEAIERTKPNMETSYEHQ